MRNRLVAAGISSLILAIACDPGDEEPQSPGVVQTTPGVPVQTASPATAPPTLGQAPQTAVPSSSATPGVSTGAPAAAPPAAPQGSITPVSPSPASSGTTPDPRSISAAGSSSSPTTTTGGAGTASAGTGATAASFNAGSGILQPDGKTIVYRIPDGTGGKDWNSKTKPIRARRGMTVRLIDDDKSTAAGGHWLHTYGQPCPHGSSAIGAGYDCVIGPQAPLGVVSGVAEHNILNGIGHLYIEVVTD